MWMRFDYFCTLAEWFKTQVDGAVVGCFVV